MYRIRNIAVLLTKKFRWICYCLNLIVYQSIEMIVNLSAVISVYLPFIMPMETDAARTFAKFWNYSLVFLDPTVTSVSSVTLVMPTRGACVSLCGMNATCCCTQWVPSNNTCTILMADRAGLYPNPLVVSAIDCM